jgi:hypothetical protein
MPEQRTTAVSGKMVHTLSTGKRIELGRLGLGDFEQCKEQCLHNWKRAQIKTWTKNLDLLPEHMRDEEVRQAFLRAEQITIADLPEKETSIPKRGKDGKLLIDPDTGTWLLEKQTQPYEVWWTSSTPEGMLYASWLSMRRCQGQENITLDEADEMFRDNEEDLEAATQMVGELSESQLKKDGAA